MPTLQLHHRKQPHEVWWLSVLLFWGVAGTISFERVASTTVRALHFPWGHVLYAGLAIWSLVGLVGIYWKKNGAVGPIVEQLGLAGLTLYGITYAIIILGNSGFRGAGFGFLIGGLSIANLVRVWQIQKYLKAAAVTRAMLGEDE